MNELILKDEFKRGVYGLSDTTHLDGEVFSSVLQPEPFYNKKSQLIMGSKFFGNKHDKQNNKNTKFNPKTNSKGKGANMGIRKVGRGK